MSKSLKRSASFMMNSRRTLKRAKKSKNEAGKAKKQHVCQECNKEFARRENLTNHLRQVHGVGGKRKTFKCEFAGCGKACSSKWNLKEHTKRHTDQRDHACDLCDHRFGQKQALKRHKNTVHKCTVCKQFFASPEDHALDAHPNSDGSKKSHAGKTYRCTRECGERFRSYDLLDKHQKECVVIANKKREAKALSKSNNKGVRAIQNMLGKLFLGSKSRHRSASSASSPPPPVPHPTLARDTQQQQQKYHPHQHQQQHEPRHPIDVRYHHPEPEQQQQHLQHGAPSHSHHSEQQQLQHVASSSSRSHHPEQHLQHAAASPHSHHPEHHLQHATASSHSHHDRQHLQHAAAASSHSHHDRQRAVSGDSPQILSSVMASSSSSSSSDVITDPNFYGGGAPPQHSPARSPHPIVDPAFDNGNVQHQHQHTSSHMSDVDLSSMSRSAGTHGNAATYQGSETTPVPVSIAGAVHVPDMYVHSPMSSDGVYAITAGVSAMQLVPSEVIARHEQRHEQHVLPPPPNIGIMPTPASSGTPSLTLPPQAPAPHHFHFPGSNTELSRSHSRSRSRMSTGSMSFMAEPSPRSRIGTFTRNFWSRKRNSSKASTTSNGSGSAIGARGDSPAGPRKPIPQDLAMVAASASAAAADHNASHSRNASGEERWFWRMGTRPRPGSESDIASSSSSSKPKLKRSKSHLFRIQRGNKQPNPSRLESSRRIIRRKYTSVVKPFNSLRARSMEWSRRSSSLSSRSLSFSRSRSQTRLSNDSNDSVVERLEARSMDETASTMSDESLTNFNFSAYDIDVGSGDLLTPPPPLGSR